MEPFRPIVDGIVKTMNINRFETEEKRKIVSILNYEFLIDGRKQTLLNTMKIYVKSVIKAIEDIDVSEISFFDYEL